jgi:hypothetical protein
MRWRAEGLVESILAERPGAQEATVRVGTGPMDSERRRAINLVQLTGRIVPGSRVLLNLAAVEMGLGTGGNDFVMAVLGGASAETGDPAGHIMKMRYTPVQTPTLAVESPESPFHDVIRAFADLDDVPVVCCELHSQLPAVCAGAHCPPTPDREGWRPRIAYIMTDSASLPLSLSRLVPQLKERGLLDVTITAGQAFGGDYEAVNLYSALACARQVVHAGIIVVGQGPGTVGTGTPLGFSGVDQGIAINATASLGGVPIAVARISCADPRARHSGISHHTVTVLTRVTRATALLPLPVLPPAERDALLEVLEQTGIATTHEMITIDAERALAALEASAICVDSMGRGISEDRTFFLAASAAGMLAAQVADARSGRDQ